MWTLILRSPNGEPIEYPLHPGINTLGRGSENDIIIPDVSASRRHAEIEYSPQADTAILRDLDSTNGIFVNSVRIHHEHIISAGDQIRVGTCLITPTYQFSQEQAVMDSRAGTRPLTRELIIESFDSHAALIYDLAGQLNTVIDINVALEKVSTLMRQAMGSDRCLVVTRDKFDDLQALGFPVSIAREAIEQRTAITIPDVTLEADEDITASAILLKIRSALCVPVLADDEVLALIYLYKTNPNSRPFSNLDTRLAIAISHMAALTIQRVQLLEKFKNEQRIRHLLQRFISPAEANLLLENYFKTGSLPPMEERVVTILFIDILDSTGLAEEFGVKQFGELLGKFYEDMTQIIFDHGGIINNYLGDGIMAVFGMSQTQSHSEESALEAGLAMLNKIREQQRNAIRPMEVGIGINTGSVMAGYIGTTDRVELSILGDTVNVAYRLAELAKPNRLFASQIAFQNLKSRFDFLPIGEINIRGRIELVPVVQVIRQQGETSGKPA